MANVLLDMATSLDGFVSGPNGEDHGLHDYFFSPAGPTADVIDEGFKTTGTIIMGRRAYDVGAAQDGFADNPYQVPTIILTHHVPQAVPKGAESFVFVTDGKCTRTGKSFHRRQKYRDRRWREYCATISGCRACRRNTDPSCTYPAR